jgi:general secretion pathway protein G
MIVITIILILVGIAAAKYDQSVRRSREAVLKQDLYNLRQAIDNYTMDKQQAPQSLEDLKGQYLHDIPPDPITQKKDWVPHYGDTVISPDQVGTGIDDVHSNSELISSEGTPYNTW